MQPTEGGRDWAAARCSFTWGDFGGFYDQVARQQIDQHELGFRVPLLVVSPYAGPGMSITTRRNLAACSNFIESDFGVANLTDRDLNTTDFTEDFDFGQGPRPAPQLAQRQC